MCECCEKCFKEFLTEPSVRDHADEVLRWQRLKHRDKESHEVFVLGILGFEQEVLVVEDDLTVHILHQDPESLRGRMNLRATAVLIQILPDTSHGLSSVY